MGNNINYQQIHDGTEYDNSYFSYDTTITKVEKLRDITWIYCNPGNDYMFCIKNNDDNFVELYNKLKIGNTYTIIRKRCILFANPVIDILPPRKYVITSSVKGFLDIKDELNISNHHEIILNESFDGRILINNDKINDIIIGQDYNIYEGL